MICKIAILVCVIAGSVTIQAINRVEDPDAIGISRDLIKELVTHAVEDLIKDCKNSSHLNDEDLKYLRRIGDHTYPPVIIEDIESIIKHRYSCYLSCVYEEAHIGLNDEMQVDDALETLQTAKSRMDTERTNKFKDCVDREKHEHHKCGNYVYCWADSLL